MNMTNNNQGRGVSGANNSDYKSRRESNRTLTQGKTTNRGFESRGEDKGREIPGGERSLESGSERTKSSEANMLIIGIPDLS